MSGPDLHLSRAEAASAALIQATIDRVAAAGGGSVVLPPGEVALDRGLRLRDGTALRGSGPDTVLRKLPAREYPLAGYANYGMRDVLLRSTAGLLPGMTAWIRDDRTCGFQETLASITWVADGRVGLDRGLESDYAGDAAPVLRTMHPLVYALDARGVAVSDLRLDGAAAGDPCELGSCRGGAVYLYACRDATVARIDEADFNGEGISFQTCRGVTVRDCRFARNRGNGLHPGAGSADVRFAGVRAEDNRGYGFFWCVRATRTTVAGCVFRGNRLGMSVGAYDCHNLVADCELSGNHGPGLVLRDDPAPCEVHHLAVRGCRIHGNVGPQVHLAGVAHDLELSGCTIEGGNGAAIAIDPGVRRVHLAGNRMSGTVAPADPGAAVTDAGADSFAPEHARHLPPPCHP